MESPRKRLSEEGIESIEIGVILADIATETQNMLADYDVDVSADEREQVIKAVQTATLEQVINIASQIEDRTIEEQFEMLVDDFEELGGLSSRSNIVAAVGFANHNEDAPQALDQFEQAFRASNYMTNPRLQFDDN